MTKDAVILVGGKGTRLQSVVSDVPKPLAPIGGRPFLTYLLTNLKNQGIERVILSTCYKADIIRSAIGGAFSGLDIEYVHETEPKGTGGAIRFVLSQLSSDRFFVMNGDTLFPISFVDFDAFHLKHKSEMSLALKPIALSGRYGSVLVENDRITGFAEKTAQGSGLINGGIYLMERDFALRFPEKVPLSLETEVLPNAIKGSQVFGYVSDSYFIDLGIPEDYQRAQTELPKLFTK